MTSFLFPPFIRWFSYSRKQLLSMRSKCDSNSVRYWFCSTFKRHWCKCRSFCCRKHPHRVEILYRARRLVLCLTQFVLYARRSQSSFPRKRKSRSPQKSWIPARASYRQLGRNDVWNNYVNLRDTTTGSVMCRNSTSKPTSESAGTHENWWVKRNL